MSGAAQLDRREPVVADVDGLPGCASLAAVPLLIALGALRESASKGRARDSRGRERAPGCPGADAGTQRLLSSRSR